MDKHMDKQTTRFTGKNARILRVVYAALSAAAALGIAAVLLRLMIHNPQEAAILCGCVAILAIIRADLAGLPRAGGEGRDRR